MRKLKRLIAKANMKKAGIYRPFKKSKDGSYFSNHWREYIG